MATEPFLGEIRLFSFSFAPRGWALCNGQLLPINQNQALFSILGTTYGGNGISTFALPNMQGNVPIHAGNGFIEGQTGGEDNHTLVAAEMPSHTHAPVGGGQATSPSPSGNLWGVNAQSTYSTATPNVAMNPANIGANGGSQPHPNQPPYLVISFCIALTGIFPSRN
ncbi:MAG: tail fiber protein [Acidimicrobiales bacterium]